MHEPNAPTQPPPVAEPNDGPEEDQIATEKMPLIPSASEGSAPRGDGGPNHGTGAAPYPVSTRAEDDEPAPHAGTDAQPSVADPQTPSPLDLAMDVLGRLQARMRAQVLGRDDVVDLVLVALLADGHVLLEDFPGSGKTTLAKSLGPSIVDGRPETETGGIVPFRRVQFTPDLLPSDVTGVSVFDAQSHGFHFRHGPVFAHVVLADEINRTSPKVQSSLLEAMAEKQVTVDNVTYPLDDLFFVIATQNPLDLAGTYPLPVAQLDRFLFKIRMDHIDRDSELAVLDTYRERRDVERTDLPKVGREEVIRARRAVDEHVVIDRRVKECLVDLAQIVRDDPRVMQGCSTRSLVLMLPALQALAALRGRDYVSADDIQALVPRVLGHRVELAPGLSDLDEVLGDALASAIEGLSRATLSRGTPSRGTSPRGTGHWGG
ncbi:MAG: AAA family ATPase [Acidobacteriota bacterium]